MRRVIAIFLVLLLLVPAFADDLEQSSDGEDVEDVEELPEEPFLDSGPIPVYLVDPEPPEPYAAGTIGPAGGYYLDVSSSALGACTVWLPYEYYNDSLSFYGGRLVSLRSGSISGIVVTGSTVYNLRFSSFLQGAEYRRPSGSSYVWTPLNVSALSGGNIEVLEDSPGYDIDISSLVIVAIILIVGVRLLGYSG